MKHNDALICDFAEVYGLYDWRTVPVKTAATLAAGLPEDSRSKRALTGQPQKLNTLLLAAIADRLSILIWQNTKSAQRGKNKPVMILDALTAPPKKDKLKTFATPSAFEAERAKFMR